MSASDPVVGGESPDRRPNVSGDLPTVLSAAPMFRRAVAGYDRFQVDTYVRWAEDELTTADREREHLVARHLDTRAALEEARRLLSHSPGGQEVLRLSDRIGSMLATAADDVASIRAEAEADRSAAAAQADRIVARAQRLLADSRAEAERVVAEAAAEAGRMSAEADRIAEEARQTAGEVRAEAAARLEETRQIEQRAARHAGEIRRRAGEEASTARAQARDEALRMLSTGREQRLRADAEAAATRERLDRNADARRAALLAEVETLEHRATALRAEVERLAGPAAGTAGGRLGVHLHRFLERVRWRSGSLRAP